MTVEGRTYKCRSMVGTIRCGFEGSNDEAGAHELESGHRRCFVDGTFLAPEETRVCGRCISRTRDALTTIRDAPLEEVLQAAAERSGQVPVDLLAMVAPGNTDALRPYKPVTGSRDVTVPHGGLVGSVSCWLPYWERRVAADGKEHYADHRGWADPLVPFAELDSIAVSWHHALNEPRRQPVPSDEHTAVQFLCGWLLKRLWAAADRAPDFNDDAPLLWQLAAQVAGRAGLVNLPETAPAKCFDCGGALIAPYRDPDSTTDEPRHGRPHEGRLYVYPEPNDDDLDPVPLPIWECADCDRVYQPAEYWLALRAFLEQQAEKAG